jgi:hypothetical protein
METVQSSATPSGGGASRRMKATRLNTQLLLQRSADFNQNLSAKFLSLTRISPQAPGPGGGPLQERNIASQLAPASRLRSSSPDPGERLACPADFGLGAYAVYGTLRT